MYSTSELLSNLFAGTLAGTALILLILLIVLVIMLLVGRIALFSKCGIAGWKAIVPFYSDYVMDVQICGLHWAFFIAEEFLTFGTYSWLVKTIIEAMRYYNLAVKFHKDTIPTTIFGALFPSIIEMVYGFSSSNVYDSNEPVGNCGFFNRVVK